VVLVKNRAAGVVRITKGCMYVSTMNIVMQDKVRSCPGLARVVPHGAPAGTPLVAGAPLTSNVGTVR
jgi:hypothetical protein